MIERDRSLGSCFNLSSQSGNSVNGEGSVQHGRYSNRAMQIDMGNMGDDDDEERKE